VESGNKKDNQTETQTETQAGQSGNQKSGAGAAAFLTERLAVSAPENRLHRGDLRTSVHLYVWNHTVSGSLNGSGD